MAGAEFRTKAPASFLQLLRAGGAAMKLRGKKVGVLAADGFEYVELIVPRDAMRLAGAEIEVISLHSGKIRGVNLTEPTLTVRVDKTLEQANPSDYDALLVPGGFIGPDFLRQSRLAREFVQTFDASQRPIATLCHGPWLLVSAELVRGRHLSSWPSLRDDIVHAGGFWHDLPLVRDRNWVSSRGPQDLHQFVPAAIDLFASGATSASTTSYPNESSPQAERPIELALTAARILPGPAVSALAFTAVGTAAGVMIARRMA
jgi:protease I